MENERFFRQDYKTYLEKLKPDSKPVWGKLTPQHMVEHLVSTWRISNGKSSAPLMIGEEEIAVRQSFLHSDKPFPRNVRNRLMGDDLLPLRKKDLPSAIAQLHGEIEDFFQYHNAHPQAVFIHPFFGELDKDGWLRFQYKHMLHHLVQFGLL